MYNNKDFAGAIVEPSQLPISQMGKLSIREVNSHRRSQNPRGEARNVSPSQSDAHSALLGDGWCRQQLIQEQVPVGE